MALERIEINPKIMLGKPTIKGTRVTVELVVRKLGEGSTVEELLDAYPPLKKDDIRAALLYAADVLAHEENVILPSSAKRQMRFLADESCDFIVVRALRSEGHDVVSVAESFQGAEDEALIEIALREERVFLTEDKDFGELIFAHQRKSGGVIFIRFPSKARSKLPNVILELVQRNGKKLVGKFTVVQPNRVRITGQLDTYHTFHVLCDCPKLELFGDPISFEEDFVLQKSDL